MRRIWILAVVLLGLGALPAVRAEEPDPLVRSRLHLAEQYFAEGRYEDALAVYREVHLAHPGNLRAARGRKMCLLELKRWDELLAMLEREHESSPQDPALLEDLGSVSAQKGDREAAARWWRGILEVQKNSRGSFMHVTELMTRHRLLDEALAVYAAADSLYPGEFTRQKASLHELRFEFDAATREYLKFLEASPSALSWVEGRLLRIGEAEEGLDPVIDRVRATLKEDIAPAAPGTPRRLHTNELVLRKLLADLALEAGRHDEARIQYFELVDDEPAQLPALLVFGKRCQADGAWDVAIRVFERIVRDVPDARAVPTALSEIARSQRELGRWEDALSTYTRLAEEFPETDYALDARFQSAKILRDDRGRVDDAEAAFRGLVAIRRGPWPEAEPQFQVAECALFRGDVETARGIFAAIRGREFSEETRERALWEEALAHFYAGAFASADSLFKEVAEVFPKGAHVNDALEKSILLNTNPDEPELLGRYAGAELALRTRRPGEAAAALEALAAEHGDAAIVDETWLLLGVARREAGDPGGAIRALDEAVEVAQVPDLAANARLLRAGILAEDLGEGARALTEYEDLLVAYPETLAADRARERMARLTRTIP